jgi:hypothetical protein
MWNVGGKLVGAVSTIADIHMIIIQVLCSELYKTNFQPSSSSFYCHRGLSVSRRRRDGLEGARRGGVTAARTVQTWMLKVFTCLDGMLFPPPTHTSTERKLWHPDSRMTHPRCCHWTIHTECPKIRKVITVLSKRRGFIIRTLYQKCVQIEMDEHAWDETNESSGRKTWREEITCVI